MKTIVTYLMLCFVFQFGFSQNRIEFSAKVLFDELPVSGAVVVNLNSEKVVLTDGNGAFSILAKTDDVLVLASDKHELKRVFLDQKLLDSDKVVFTLVRKTEELDEVVVAKANIPKIEFDWSSAKYAAMEKKEETPKTVGVNNGDIDKGTDFVGIGRIIKNWFVKPQKKSVASEPDFKTLLRTNVKDDFFINDLNLKPEQISFFLEYCNVDPKSKNILESKNELILMDFLFTKNTEFKKLLATNN